MEIDVWEIYAILVFYFILKWIPIVLLLAIVIRLFKEVKEKAGEKVKGFESMMKGESEKDV